MRTTAADAGRPRVACIGGAYVTRVEKSGGSGMPTSIAVGVVADFGRGRCWWSGAENVRARRRSAADVGLGRGILATTTSEPRVEKSWPPVKPRRLAKVVEPRMGVEAEACMWSGCRGARLERLSTVAPLARLARRGERSKCQIQFSDRRGSVAQLAANAISLIVGGFALRDGA